MDKLKTFTRVRSVPVVQHIFCTLRFFFFLNTDCKIAAKSSVRGAKMKHTSSVIFSYCFSGHLLAKNCPNIFERVLIILSEPKRRKR